MKPDTFDATLADQILQLIVEEDILMAATIAERLRRDEVEIDDILPLVPILVPNLIKVRKNHAGYRYAEADEIQHKRIETFLAGGGFAARVAEDSKRIADRQRADSARQHQQRADDEASRLKTSLEIEALRRQAKESRLAKLISIAAIIIALGALIAQIIQIFRE